MQPHEIEEQLTTTGPNEQITPKQTDQTVPSFWGWAALFDFLRTLAIVFLAAFVIRHFLVQPFIVDGQSMQPTFKDQEYILVDKLTYQIREPNRGEVIVFHPPGEQQENYIKRIIGLPGETVEIRDSKIFVNGQAIPENYTQSDTETRVVPDAINMTQILGPNEYFVMGDNRNHSKDSRELGPIGKDRIIGRAWVVLFPIEDLTLVNHPAYPVIITPLPSTATSQTTNS